MQSSSPQHNSAPDLERYRGYNGLPPLVGLQEMKDAATRGLTVAESVDRIKRLHWALKRLHGIFVARLAGTPVYELKMAFSLHAFVCAEHVGEMAKRIREMRQPPYGLELSPSAPLDAFFDELLSSPDEGALVLGIYGHAMPAIQRGVERLLADTNRIFDYPTFRLMRFAQMEIKDAADYGREAVTHVQAAEDLTEWESVLKGFLAAAGDLDGTAPESDSVPQKMFSAVPYKYDGAPRRDERFKDPYNMGVNAEAMLFDPDIPPLPKSLMLYFKRMREIDVPEVVSGILAETAGKPWDYYRDMTRQLWDEARHAMMGEIAFVAIGIDWTEIPFNFTWSLGLNTRLTPLERHAVLYNIEQGLMPKKHGKEYEWEIAVATTNRLTALIQDYDWADEILHARIGRDWLVPELGSQQLAIEYGDQAWSRILTDWAKWRDAGMTYHENWWPKVYRHACEHWGVPAEPALLAYNTTYENTRADLKHVSG